MMLWGAAVRGFMFNRRARKSAESILERLAIAPGSVVGDIGSGGGFFAMEFARIVGDGGKVFAVDIDPNLLEYVRGRLRSSGVLNVECVPGDSPGCSLPSESCDLLFMRNVFHHIAEPAVFFRNMRRSLKPKGRFAVIEWRAGETRLMRRHSAKESTIIDVLTEAGLQHIESWSFLESQSFTIFQK